MLNLQQIVALLGLEVLPHEGGMYRETYKDSDSSCIYWAVGENDFSALHRLDAPEIYHYYAGAPLDLLILHPDGRAERHVLGPDLLAGQRPQIRVPAGCWQGSSSTGQWTLLGTTMTPSFSWEGFELGGLDLAKLYASQAERIQQLVRVAANNQVGE